MVEFIHKLTGSRMFVAEDRVEEYVEAGHKLVSAPSEKPKKTTSKKSTSKKKTSTAKAKEK